LCASTNSYPWPNLNGGPETPERLTAAKRLSQFEPCKVCRLVLQGTMGRVSDEERLEQLLNRDFLSDHAGGASALCSMKELAPRLRSLPLTVKLHADGSASLVVAGKGEKNVSSLLRASLKLELDFPWHFISHGISQACNDIFRRDLEWLAGAVSEAYETEKAKASKAAGGNKETWTYYMHSALQRHVTTLGIASCNNLKSPLVQQRDAETERALAKTPSIVLTLLTFGFPKRSILMRLSTTTRFWVCRILTRRPDYEPTIRLCLNLRLSLDFAKMSDNSSGIKEGETVLGELSQAFRVLTDRVARRQYNRSRDQLDLEVVVGLRPKRKKTRIASMDIRQ